MFHFGFKEKSLKKKLPLSPRSGLQFYVGVWNNIKLYTMKDCMISFKGKIFISVSAEKTFCYVSPKFDYYQNLQSKCSKQDQTLYSYRLMLYEWTKIYLTAMH